MKDWEPRFWAKVNKTDTCWLWTSPLSEKGYGSFSVGGRRNPVRKRAHVWSFELAQGPVPAGHVVDHECRVKHCVRPDHLRPLTPKQNQEHRAGAQRNSKSGIRGVCWNARYGKWLATVKSNGKQVYREMFYDLEEAEREVIKARQRIFTHSGS